MSDQNLQRQQDAYDLRLQVNRLEQQLHEADGAAELDQLLSDITTARSQLAQIEQEIAVQDSDPQRGILLDFQDKQAGPVTRSGVKRGTETTGLDVKIHLKMQHIPTGIYHLLDPWEDALISCQVKNHSSKIRRVRIASYLEGYTARSVDTAEIEPGQEFEIRQLPTLFPESIRAVNELTRATLNLLVDDLDGKVETHKTEPLWLLSRNSAPLYVRDPTTNGWNDLTRYLGAFVTPNAPDIIQFLRMVAEHHPKRRLYGYQEGQDVESQVRAIFDALKTAAEITYVNSTVTFNPEESARSQRVRLPRESLEERQANCIDGTLLFASLLEATSLSPAIVLIPGHAFVAWETDKRSNVWHYLETMKIGDSTFEEAVALGEKKAETYAQFDMPQMFQQWSLRDLRTKHQITPLE